MLVRKPIKPLSAWLTIKRSSWKFRIKYPCKGLSVLVLTLACLAYDLNSFPINPGDELRIRHYNLQHGLSQATINDLLVDQCGFAWIATEDGLNRFDGREFKHYKHDPNDPASIPGNVLNKLLEDKEGRIWVGSIGNGLSYYDLALDNFQMVGLENVKEGGNVTISDMAVQTNGTVWVTTRTNGLHSLRPTEDDFYVQHNYFADQRLGALLLDEGEKLWVGGFYGEVYRMDSPGAKAFDAKPEIKVNGYVQAFYRTPGHLLIGSDFGFFIYDLNSKEVRPYELQQEGQHPTKHVVAFLKEDDSHVWIGTGNGLYLFNWESQEVVNRIAYQDQGEVGLSTNTVYSLARLSDRQVLVGTAGHLNLLDFSKPYFKTVSKNKRGYHWINDNVVLAVLKDGNDLWAGTADGGLNLIREGKSYFFLEDLNDDHSLPGSAVMGIAKDERQNRLWLATTRGLGMIDLTTFDPNDPEFTVFHHDPADTNSITMDYLTDVVVDQQGNVWGATYGGGVFCMEFPGTEGVSVTRYEAENHGNSISDDFAYCIRTGPNGSIWIGTERGLTKLEFLENDYASPKFTRYYKTGNKPGSLSHNAVIDILIDAKQRTWAATRDGLNLLLDDNTFESWTGQEQFPNAVVYSVQDDDEGNLWMGTNDGLVKFDPRSRSFMHYGLEDGIQGKEFNISARYKDEDGTVYFGGIGGLTFFNPADLKDIDVPRPIYLSQLRVKGEGNVLQYRSTQKTKFEFGHDQFPFYLKFSSIDYRFQKDIEYAYRLLPVDEEWNILDKPEFQFVNLSPGKYTLQLNGFSRGIEWDQPPLEIKLQVLPPWWATWWAYVLYSCCFVLLGYRFYRFQVSKKLAVAESLWLKEVDQLKSRVYTNITHEFRTPLTVILGMADAIRSKAGHQLQEALETITDNGKNLLKLVNEMLDLAKLESGNLALKMIQSDIVSFVKYLCKSYETLAEEHQIDLTVYSEIDMLVMDFDDHRLQSVISNLLSNALKFSSPGGSIVVHLNQMIEKEKEWLILKVNDNGQGIPKEVLPHIFDRFYQAEGSNTRHFEGTGIGLALTKDLVELMGGTIGVKSVITKGSQFTVKLPVHRNAIKARSQQPVDDLLAMRGHTGQTPRPQAIDNLDMPMVLLIEDNPDVAHYIVTCLGNKYNILQANDGKTGMDMAYEQVPDIIICDVMMPGIDGFKVCATLKSDERTDHIPIILLTAKVTHEDRITGLSHGADAYVIKPFEKTELLTRLDQLIIQRKKMLKKIGDSGMRHLPGRHPRNPELKFLEKVVKIVHEELANPTFSPSYLAKKLQLSESQVYRKLKAITDKSTAVFIRSVRLQKAKELLLSSNKTVSEIGYEVGFNDPSWFSRAFREEFGIAPSKMHK